MIVEGVAAVVACPRCGRFGVVYPDAVNPNTDTFRVAWADPRAEATRPFAPFVWQDTAVSGAELHDPRWGCGYDCEPAQTHEHAVLEGIASRAYPGGHS